MTRRQRAGVVLLALGFLAGALTPALLRGGRPSLTVLAYELGVGILFVVAGLLAAAKRPDSAVGGLLTIAGLVWLAARTLVWFGSNSAVFTLGLVLVLLPIGLVAHLAVVFPSGRLSSTFERLVVTGSYVVILTGVLLLELSGCPECPSNLLAVSRDDDLGRLLHVAIRVATLVAIAAFCTVLVTHWNRGTRAARRVLAPVLPTALLYAAVSAAGLLAELGAPFGSGRTWEAVGRVAIAAVPVAFLAGLLRSRLARSDVGRLVVELGVGAPADRLQSALARTLGDPSVEVAYWTPETGRYVGGDGLAMTLPDDGSRAITLIERAGHQVGALVHDPALRDEPVLLAAVSAAAGLSMENERLNAEVLARLDEVQASRARIVQAADAERLRVERNLHDGAQQRLVTLSLALSMARRQLTDAGGQPGPHALRCLDALLSEAADELTSALRELRELARGLHPAILVDEGLGAAVEALADRSAVPVTVTGEIHGRLPAPVEAAAYYVVSESLANVSKYAKASSVTVHVARDEHRLVVDVTDDGSGGAKARPGSGLEGLADRLAALDGQLTVESHPMRGTRVSASLPCA